MKNKLRKWIFAYSPFVFGFILGIVFNLINAWISSKSCSDSRYESIFYHEHLTSLVDNEEKLFQKINNVNSSDKHINTYSNGVSEVNGWEDEEGNHKR